MAAPEISAELAEVVSALDPSKIPDKLHCPICDGFLLNAYKLHCCDQPMCESCHSKISDTCPLCEHQPLSADLLKPARGIRGTAKAFLKTQEKKLADERAKTQAAAIAEVSELGIAQNDVVGDGANGASSPGTAVVVKKLEDASITSAVSAADVSQHLIEASDDYGHEITIITTNDDNDAATKSTTTETPAPKQIADTEPSPRDDKVEQNLLVGETSQSKGANATGQDMNMNMSMNGFPNMLSMNAGVNMTDPAQMMQFLATNGMNGFNSMMGMPNMGMNQMPQGMFGGFGGPGMGMNGMNGMNMGMNFNPNAGMYGAGWNSQNNNMWNGPQSNNPNAFSNGIGGDFGSNSGYGYNMSPSANFHQQQQPPHGDFGHYSRGLARGRGRGRGGFNKNRNSFNTFSQGNQPHFQNAHEQAQYEIQNMQAQMLSDQPDHSATNGQKPDPKTNDSNEAPQFDDDEFAPGGQEEVQEALGEDYHRSHAEQSKNHDQAADGIVIDSIEIPDQAETQENGEGDTSIVDGQPEVVEKGRVQSPATYGESMDVPEGVSPKVEVPREEPKASMAPPSAPSGPSGQYRESEDYGFRARGPGKFASRNRGSLSGPIVPPVSPLRAAPQLSTASPPNPRGIGVIGAPTGPKAMREPCPKPARPLSGNPSGSLSNNAGFKIMGRASMASQDSEPSANYKSRSNTPVNGSENHVSKPRSRSRQHSRHSGRDNSRYEAEPHDEYDRDYDRDRKRSRKSRRDEIDDYEVQDADQRRSRSRTPSDRKSSHRSRRDKDHHSSSHKRHSSRSRRERNETNGDKSQEQDDYGVPAQSSRDLVGSQSRSSHRGHRSSKSSKYDDRDREDKHRDRKRSRHDRDQEDGAADEEDSRHRSRRHKREHRDELTTNGNGTSGRSHHPSEPVTPVESEKDPHTLEREARNRERMAKEEQRRANAKRDDYGAGGSGKRRDSRISGGRRVSYKYEEDLQSSMVETERESARWRYETRESA